jgi:DNA-binding CsgD family transcriptional regulator
LKPRVRISRSLPQSADSDQIERDILMKELLAQMTPKETFVIAHKMAGHTSAAIAAKLGCAPATVDVTVWRVRQKLRAFVGRSGATL